MSLFSNIKDLFQADRAIKRKQEELSNLEKGNCDPTHRDQRIPVREDKGMKE